MDGQHEDHPQDQNKFKRKRKKSFLKNARKYAKKGCYGRGSQLDADTYQYFVRIMEAYRAGFDSEEDKKIFVENVFQQTDKEEINCSCNQVGCRVIEMLLPFANDLVIQRFVTAFSSDLRPLCGDRFCSHVIEALFIETCNRSFNKDTNESDKKVFTDFTLKLSRFLLNNLEDFVWDTYANHVIRSVFQNLLRIPKDDPKQKAKPVEVKIEDIPTEYSEVAVEFAERLINWPQFKELPTLELTSGLLQVLMKGLQKVNIKLLKQYSKKLLEECFVTESKDESESSNKWPQVFFSKPALMVLEVAIETAAPKQFTQIYAKCFIGKLARLATTRNTNFAVQKLIMCCKEKTEFEAMFDELADHFEEIIKVGHTGVMFALAQACKNLLAKQGTFIQNLMKALHCVESEEKEKAFLICLCKMVTYETLQQNPSKDYEKAKLNLHGTLILQNILEFNKPIKAVNALLAMDTNELKSLFSNTMGSHIVDSFVQSKFIGEKSRERLVRKLQGTYQDLAATKFGSRSFEALWSASSSNIKLKQNIMQELAYKDGLWANSEFGKIIASKVDLALYKRNKDDWINSLNSNKLTDLKQLLQ